MSNEFFTPQSRNEAILQNICGAENELPAPAGRIEKLLQAILYEDETIVDFEPESRAELLLYAILTHGEYDAEPQSRNETILKAILTNGEYDALPQSRIEALLIEWLDQTHYEEKTVSCDVVSISDAVAAPVVDLTAAIVPVQSGSGDPYPPGGGKNLVNAEDKTSISKQTTILNDFSLPTGTYTLSGYLSDANGIGVNLRLLKGGVSFSYTGYVYSSTQTRVNVTFQVESTDILKLVFAGVAVGYNGSVSNVQIESGSTATEYAPYSNIRPISGWTECKVQRAGKNLLKLVESEMVSSGWNRRFPNVLTKAGTYTISCVNTFGGTGTLGARVTIYNESFQKIGDGLTPYNFGSTNKTVTFTLTEEQTRGAYISFDCQSAGCTFESIANAHIQVELGSAATAYEPYRGDTYTVTFGSAGTVYGGTLDVTTGKLTVDKAMVDAGTLNWTYWIGNRFYASVTGKTATAVNSVICSCYKSVTSVADVGIYNQLSNIQKKSVYITDPSFSQDAAGAAALKESLSGQQIVYELATPLVYDLSPVEIRTLAGQNTIWADTGDVTVTYKAQRTAAALMMMAGRF